MINNVFQDNWFKIKYEYLYFIFLGILPREPVN